MATASAYQLIWVNSDGSLVGVLAAEWDAPAFLDFGHYLLPYDFSL